MNKICKQTNNGTGTGNINNIRNSLAKKRYKLIYKMVDSKANTAEDLLIDSFQFKIPQGASYVTDRRTISYFTAGSNIYQSGAGTKIVRINLTGDGWLDPGSIRLHYTLVNNDTIACPPS